MKLCLLGLVYLGWIMDYDLFSFSCFTCICICCVTINDFELYFELWTKYKSRGFETSRDLTIRRIFGYWDGAQGWGLPNQFLPFRYLVKTLVTFEYHVHIWQESLQVNCNNTRHIWKWFQESKRHSCKFQNFLNEDRSFSNPHPWGPSIRTPLDLFTDLGLEFKDGRHSSQLGSDGDNNFHPFLVLRNPHWTHSVIDHLSIKSNVVHVLIFHYGVLRHQSGYGLNQWEEALLCNASSHWPSPYPKWSLPLRFCDYSNTCRLSKAALRSCHELTISSIQCIKLTHAPMIYRLSWGMDEWLRPIDGIHVIT